MANVRPFSGVLHGFSLTLDDSKAPLLANEPTVCWVEQDMVIGPDS